MQITFLGTGTSHGVPLIGCRCEVCLSTDLKDKRLRSSIWIRHQNLSVVIDAGPDLRQQALCMGIDRIDGILLTHEHRDHVAGLDELRAYNYIQNEQIKIYSESRVLQAVRAQFAYAFSPSFQAGVPEFDLHKIGLEPFKINELLIRPLRVYHHQLPIFGFQVGSLVYLTDVSHIPTETIELIKHCDMLIINSLRKKPHPAHFCLKQSLEAICAIQPQRAYLTHISHQMGLHQQVSMDLPQEVSLAFDGLEVLLND